MIKVIKRDGRTKNFDKHLIEKAVGYARKDIGCDDENLDLLIADEVVNELQNNNVEKVTVEEIQDLVVKWLKIYNSKVEKVYSEYREKRSLEREENMDTYKKMNKILSCKDVLNSNANVDEWSFGGRKFEGAGVIMKHHALHTIMPKEFMDAHINNEVYQHDLDSYSVGLHNCSFVDARKLINETGFETRNGDVRPANGLSTAFQQLAVIFQIQSQEQYGGTASGHIDYDLEPQVNISFRKYFAEARYLLGKRRKREKDEFKNNYFTAKTCHNKDYKRLPGYINIENLDTLYRLFPDETRMAMEKLDEEGNQSAQGLYHNLNTLN